MLRCLSVILFCLLMQQVHAQSTPTKLAEMCVGDTAYLSVTYNNADSIQWFRNDTAIAGTNNDTLITKLDGRYYARVYEGKRCFDQSGDIYIYYNFPQLIDDQYTVPITRNFMMDVLKNDQPTCAPFDLSTFKIIEPPAIGTIVSNAEGRVLYRPSINELGTDHFTYVIKDIEGRLANIARVTIDLDLSCAILYPNPTTGLTHIVVNNQKIESYAVYDGSGRMLFNKPINATLSTLDFSGLAQGMYVVKFIEHDGVGCSIKVRKD